MKEDLYADAGCWTDNRDHGPLRKPGEIIDYETELYVGMQIIEEGEVEGLTIAWVDTHRDRNVVVYDWDGHSHFIEDLGRGPKYRVLENGKLKYRFVYGESAGGPLRVTEKYYGDIREFRAGEGKHNYVAMLGSTGRFIYEDNNSNK